MAVNSFNAQNPPVTTKGDVFTFSTIPTRLGVGANDTVLTADSTTATGLKWASVSSGLTLLASNTLTTNTQTVTFSSISGTYKALKVILVGMGNRGSGGTTNDDLTIYFNNDTTTTNYFRYGTVGNAGNNASFGDVIPGAGTNNGPLVFEMTIPAYANTTLQKSASGYMGFRNTSASGTSGGYTFWWTNTAAINRIDLIAQYSTWRTGSTFLLYGLA